MSELYLAFTITDRIRSRDVVKAYQEAGVSAPLVTLGKGTASSEILNIFGLDEAEKAICFGITTDSTWEKIKKTLERRLRIDVPGTGIAFTVPLGSVGGKRELMFLTTGQGYEKEEESHMKDTTYSLLVVIANQGYSDMVMDAARSAGAGGGTILHAKGSGMEKAEQFMGISLAAEKDVIFIVTRTEKKNEMMKTIMRDAGVESKAGSILFSLPVTDTAGLRLTSED